MTPRDLSRRLILFAFALIAIGVAFLGFSTPGQRPALASPPPTAAPPMAAANSAESCRPSLGEQLKAIKAFGEMMPVFLHPRCLNCHGGLDLYSDKHPGASSLDDDLDFSLLTRDLRDSASAKHCDVCHDNIERKDRPSQKGGWMIPNPPVFFVDGKGKPKSNEELCLQMKRMEENADSFESHIKKDHNTIQFIKAGYAGDRALGAEELARLELKREPPKGNQADLAAKASKWVKLLDGHWKEPPGRPSSPPSKCGCVMPKIKLQVEHRSAIDPNHISHRAGQIGFSGDANFEVTLTPVHEAQGRVYYTGTKSLVRPLQVYHVARGCRGTASEKEDWLWSAEVDAESEEMTLQWGFTTSDEKGQSVCIRGGYRDEMPLDPSIFGGQSDEPLVMPLDSAATKELTAKEENGSGQEWLRVKVIGVAGE